MEPRVPHKLGKLCLPLSSTSDLFSLLTSLGPSFLSCLWVSVCLPPLFLVLTFLALVSCPSGLGQWPGSAPTLEVTVGEAGKPVSPPHGAAQPSRAGGDQAGAWGAGRWCRGNEAERYGERRRPMGPEARMGGRDGPGDSRLQRYKAWRMED